MRVARSGLVLGVALATPVLMLHAWIAGTLMSFGGTSLSLGLSPSTGTTLQPGQAIHFDDVFVSTD